MFPYTASLICVFLAILALSCGSSGRVHCSFLKLLKFLTFLTYQQPVNLLTVYQYSSLSHLSLLYHDLPYFRDPYTKAIPHLLTPWGQKSEGDLVWFCLSHILILQETNLRFVNDLLGLTVRMLCSKWIANPKTRSMYWRRASIQDGQASTSAWWRHCLETVFPW